jgi:hypothetical protein
MSLGDGMRPRRRADARRVVTTAHRDPTVSGYRELSLRYEEESLVMCPQEAPGWPSAGRAA